jgi:chorismate lyase / 3-hydroxybenzoate synthase
MRTSPANSTKQLGTERGKVPALEWRTDAAGSETVGSPEPVPEPPRWVFDLVPEPGKGWRCLADGLSVRFREGERFAFVSVAVAHSRRCSAAGLEERALEAYRLISRHLQMSFARHPVRLWNFIPGILEPLDDLPQRYMAFNAGRYRACQEWGGGSGSFPTLLAAASGVGHGGEQLLVHCLASPLYGTPVENPNQISSYHYSSRYGAFPPCFARATRVAMEGGRRMALLVAGTASVRGEDSVHAGDFHAQAEQTLQNLSALVTAAMQGMDGAEADHGCRDPLGLFRSLRVYHPREEHRPAVRRLIQEWFPTVQEVELLRTDLCRSELLVEIEGVADLGPATIGSTTPRSIPRLKG